jgi:hypothetical protein
MFIAIVQHTPAWVWGLLAALTALGLSQAREREVGLARVTLLPLAMVALSLGGVLSAFGPAPVALGGWIAGLGLALVLGARFVPVRNAAWSPQTATLHVPGSWLPLALILGLFALKYTAGVNLALHPRLAGDPGFASLCSLAYGGFSGLFLAQALSLRALATRRGAARAA